MHRVHRAGNRHIQAAQGLLDVRSQRVVERRPQFVRQQPLDRLITIDRYAVDRFAGTRSARRRIWAAVLSDSTPA